MSKIVDLKAPMDGYLFRLRLKTSIAKGKRKEQKKS